MKLVDARSCHYGDGLEVLFNEVELEVASTMLELSVPVVFEDDETLVTWGATKPRTGAIRQQQPPKVPPSSSSSPVPEVGTSPSSCLSGEAVHSAPKQSMKEELGEVSSMYERLKGNNSTQRNIFPIPENLPEEREAFSTPITQQHLISGSQRVFREQRTAKPKRDRDESQYVYPTSSKHKYY